MAEDEPNDCTHDGKGLCLSPLLSYCENLLKQPQFENVRVAFGPSSGGYPIQVMDCNPDKLPPGLHRSLKRAENEALGIDLDVERQSQKQKLDDHSQRDEEVSSSQIFVWEGIQCVDDNTRLNPPDLLDEMPIQITEEVHAVDSSMIPSADLNASDPLLIEQWPKFLWNSRRLSFQSLPSPDAICRNSGGCVVYWIKTTIRAKDNLALELAAWLSHTLEVPFLVVAVIDKETYDDVFATFDDPLVLQTTSSDEVNVSEVQLTDGLISESTGNHRLLTEPPPPKPSYSQRRRSFAYLAALEALQIELEMINVPLLGLIIDSELSKPPSCTEHDSIGVPVHEKTSERGTRECIENLASALPGGLFALFTDEICHPAHTNVCQYLSRGALANVPIISIDSCSFNSTTLSADSTSESHFTEKFDAAAKQLVLQTWSIFGAAELSATVQNCLFTYTFETLVGGNISQMNWPECRRRVREFVDSSQAADKNHMKNMLISARTSSPCCWSERRAIEFLDELLESAAAAVHFSLEDGHISTLLHCVGYGLISPATLYRVTGQQPRVSSQHLWRSIRPILIDMDRARAICNGLSKSKPSSIIQHGLLRSLWQHELESLGLVAEQSVVITTGRMLLHPFQVCAGRTTDSLFNAIQLRLIESGQVPMAYEAQYWLAFLIMGLASPELALQTALIEISRHATARPQDFASTITQLIVTTAKVLSLLLSKEKEFGLMHFETAMRDSYSGLAVDRFVARYA